MEPDGRGRQDGGRHPAGHVDVRDRRRARALPHVPQGRQRSSATSPRCSRWSARRGRLHEAVALQARFPTRRSRACIGAGLAEFVDGVDALGPAGTRSDRARAAGARRQPHRWSARKKRELASLQRGLPVLATISSSAPFVGLFGTVFGIITAFQQMADPSKGGGGGLATVSAGIAEALLTTAVGLAVAIVSVWFYNFFTTRLETFGGLIDDATGELADRMLLRDRRARRCRRARPCRGRAAGRARRVTRQTPGDARRAALRLRAIVQAPRATTARARQVGHQRHAAGRRGAGAADHLHGGHAADRERRRRWTCRARATTPRKPDDGKDIIVSVTEDKRVYMGATRGRRRARAGATADRRAPARSRQAVFLKGDARAPYGVGPQGDAGAARGQRRRRHPGTEELRSQKSPGGPQLGHGRRRREERDPRATST